MPRIDPKYCPFCRSDELDHATDLAEEQQYPDLYEYQCHDCGVAFFTC
jgi:transposase-like protein